MKKELQNNFIIISIIILCVLITCVILYFIFKPHKQNYVNTKYFRDIRENFDIKELLLNKQCKDGNCVGLGKGFLLRDIDFLSSDSLDSFFIEGKDVFNNVNFVKNPDSFSFAKGSNLNYTIEEKESTSLVSKTLINETNLGGSFPTATFSIDGSFKTLFNKSSSSLSNIQSAYLDIHNNSGSINYKYATKFDDINLKMIEQFHRLPPIIGKIDDGPGSGLYYDFRQYNDFLRDWGSHIITKLIYGCKITFWKFIESNKSNDSKRLAASLCAEAKSYVSDILKPLKENFCNNDMDCNNDGNCINNKCKCKDPFFGENCSMSCPVCKNDSKCNKITGKCDCELGWSGSDCSLKDSRLAGLCAKFSSVDSSELDSRSVKTIVIISGGSREKRLELFEENINLTNLNEPLIRKTISEFLGSVDESDNPTNFAFTPIWVVISEYFRSIEYGGKNKLFIEQLLNNLEAAYFYGPLNNCNCTTLKSRDNIVYQEFKTIPTEGGLLNKFGCWVKKEGCSTDNDCKFSLLNGFCRAGGSSAFVKGEQKFGDKYNTKIRFNPTGDSNDGINDSCSISASGCKCDNKLVGDDILPDRYIWLQ